jgi:CHASE2 domain-containing sensor protein
MSSARIRRAMRKEIVVQSLLISILLTGCISGAYVLIRGAVYSLYEQLSYTRFLDLSYEVRGAVRQDNQVCIVGIDSLPVNHEKLARGLAVIKRSRPRVIGLDVLLESAQSRADTLLGQEMACDIPIVLPYEFRQGKRQMPDLLYNHPNVTYGHAYLRHSSLDEIVRWFTTSEMIGGEKYPSFAAEMAVAAGYRIGELFTAEKNYLINYAGEYDRFVYLTLNELLSTRDSSVLSVLMGEKLVLVGYTADSTNMSPAFRDLFRTPFTESRSRQLEGRMYGVEIHANILYTLVNGRKIREWGVLPGVLISIVLIFSNFLGQSLFINLPRRKRRRLFWIAVACEFAALFTLPLLLFVMTDQAFDVTIPLIALLLFPKAEALYYRYFDNIGLPLRRYRLRKLPSFVTHPFLEIFEASTLGDRLAAALNAGAVLLPFARFVLGSSSVVNAPPGWARQLKGPIDDLDDVFTRGQRVLHIQGWVRQAHLTWRGDANDSSKAAEGFQPSLEHMSVSVAPRHGFGVYYENYFLELMAAIKELLWRIRPGFNGDPREAGLKNDGREISMSFRRHRLVLSPFVEWRTCLKHRVPEYFVRSASWNHAGTNAPPGAVWVGSSSECLCTDGASPPPVVSDSSAVISRK